jgi:hypothetical protein
MGRVVQGREEAGRTPPPPEVKVAGMVRERARVVEGWVALTWRRRHHSCQ